MNASLKIVRAKTVDFPHVNLLLKQSDLPEVKFESESVDFFLAKVEKKIIGCIGFEKKGELALMRSAAIAQTHRGQQIGTDLVQFSLGQFEQMGITDVYLLTKNAAIFFSRHGFVEIERSRLPEILLFHDQISGDCCASAVVMHKKIQDSFTRFVILLTAANDQKGSLSLVKQHIQYLRSLDRKGCLVMCGPFTDSSSGMIIIKAAGIEQAKAIASEDPLVQSGFRNCEVRTWQISCESNNHLGAG